MKWFIRKVSHHLYYWANVYDHRPSFPLKAYCFVVFAFFLGLDWIYMVYRRCKTGP